MITAEGAVLASCVANQHYYDELLKLGLGMQMFTEIGAKVFSAIVKYRTEHKVDEIVIPNLELEVHSKKQLLDALAGTTTFAYEQHFKRLEKDYIHREKEVILKDSGDSREACLQAAVRLVSLAESGQLEEEDLESAIERTIKLVEKRQAADYNNKFAFKEEYHRLNALGYYEPGTLLTLGGGSGHGKSTWMLNATLKWLKSGLNVVYFSNEMDAEILLTKLVCIETALPWKEVMNSSGTRLTEEGKETAVTALEAFKDLGLRVYTKNYTLPEMSLILKTYHPDVFILDTINALIETKERTDIALGNLARLMKSMAQEIDALAVVVAQLKDIYGRPTDKDDVKESRQIRDASDYMDFVYREFEKNPHSKHVKLEEVFELYRVKGRLTGIGQCFMRFEKDNGRITEYSNDIYSELTEYMDKYKRALYREAT